MNAKTTIATIAWVALASTTLEAAPKEKPAPTDLNCTACVSQEELDFDAATQAELDSAQSDLGTHAADAQAQVAALKAQIDALQAQVATMQAQVDANAAATALAGIAERDDCGS